MTSESGYYTSQTVGRSGTTLSPWSSDRDERGSRDHLGTTESFFMFKQKVQMTPKCLSWLDMYKR